MVKVIVDLKKAQFYGGPIDYKPDLALYESKWVPKIKAYNEKLQNAIPKEYLVPDALVPNDLDKTPFNATLIPGKVLDEKTLEITSLKAVEIAAKIASKELTAVETLQAFAKRATIAHQLTNCAMEIFFDEGLKRAEELDDYLEKTGKTVGPFHGVPVSLKEHYNYAGHVTNGGFVSTLDNVTEEFSLTNQVLYDLGAVFYIRTTEPQSLMHLDSINNITGRGKNCYKTSMSPGGSSSGEGALIGMRGSPLGIGSDIGGSIRAPCAFNGIYGIKPSSKRVSMKGSFSPGETTSNELIVCAFGPMSNSIEDLEFFMENYVANKPWLKDECILPIPWRQVPKPKRSELTIGIVYDDGVVKPHPPIIRALKTVEAKLKKAGVNVVVWDSHKTYECVALAYNGFTADGGHGSKEFMSRSGEPAVTLTEHFMGFGSGSKVVDLIEFETMTYERDCLRSEYHDLFEERGVDFIIAPTYAGTAPKPATVKYWGYTVLWNLLDLPGVVIPSGVFGDKDIDLKDTTYKPRNKYEDYEYGLYDPEASDGMPVGLTVVGRHYTEEETLKAAKVIDEVLKE